MATAQASVTNESVPTGDDAGAGDESLRDTLEAAFEKSPTDEVTTERAARDDAAATDGRARDEFGRFQRGKPAATQAPAEATEQAQAPATAGAPAQGAAQAAAAPGEAGKELKPPASWTPQAREEWGSLSPRIKAEVHRREYEAQRVVQEGAQARQFIAAFENVVRPYEMFIRAENSSPLQAVQNMMQTAAELRVGTPISKANLVAGIIRNFGIDVKALDTILAGQQPDPSTQQAATYRDPRVDQLLAMQQQQAQQQAQRDDSMMRDGLAAFGETHEFYRDVAATMADLVEVRARQGAAIDLEQIYKQACQMTEGVATILAQRASAGKTVVNSNAVLRAKRAAASVRSDSTPGGATIPRDDSIRASLEAAIESAGGRI